MIKNVYANTIQIAFYDVYIIYICYIYYIHIYVYISTYRDTYIHVDIHRHIAQYDNEVAHLKNNT